MGSFGSIHRGSTSNSSVLMSSSSSWGLTLRRRKDPLLVTSFLVRWELSTSRIPCSSKWGMPSATSKSSPTKGVRRPWYLLRLFAPLVVRRRGGSRGASECKIVRGRLDGLFSCPTPIRTALVEGSVEGIAILAAVLVRVVMRIADTNPHSSMVDEDGNERVPESILLGMISEDGRGHVGATSLLRETARAISNVWPIPLRFATLRVRGRLGDRIVQSPGVCWSLLGSEAVIAVRGTVGDAALDGALI